jgi:acyl transferase domain-containing protein
MSFPPIAVVGQGCVLPGAFSPEALWGHVVAGHDLLGPVPPGYWRVGPRVLASPEEWLPEQIWSDRGGYVRGFEEVFDPEGFALPAAEVLEMDEQLHWVLFAGRAALGGQPAAALRRCGLVLGNLAYPTFALSRYAESAWLERAGGGLNSGLPRPHPRNRFHAGSIAHLTAAALRLGAGALALDAACASSLYALKLACDRLHDGRADLMLAGAVNRTDDLLTRAGFCAPGALSRTGQSRPFHRDADGLVPAEGAALVLLKRLEDAVAAGDVIHGVIRGIGLSNDGRRGGFLSPSPAGQEAAPRSLLDRPGELVRVGVTLAYAHTALLRHALGLRPRWALGYSLGEVALYACLGFYQGPRAALRRLCDGDLGRAEIAGPMTLVRQQWGLPPARPGEPPPWESQVFALSRGEVGALLADEPRVFLTQVNTPREVVLSGEPAALRRLAARLSAAGTVLPVALALHCELTRAAHAELLRLAPAESQPCPGLTFYSSAYNAVVPHNARAVGRAVVECFCRTVDFPALVETVYAGGARVFVEVGPRRNCSTWVEAILAGREHAAVPLDNKGVGDAASWGRALAQLLAHRVALDGEALVPPLAGTEASCRYPSRYPR